MHQIAELNLVTMSIEKVEVRLFQPEKFKTHTSLLFSTAQTLRCDPHPVSILSTFFFPGPGIYWQPCVVTWQCWAKGILLASSAAYQQHLYQETQIRSDWEIPSLTIFDYLHHRLLLANFNTSHHIKSQGDFNCGSSSQADFILKYFLSNFLNFHSNSPFPHSLAGRLEQLMSPLCHM